MILGDLIELTSAMTAGVKVETVMDQVIEAALNLTGAEEASIFMLDTFGQTLHRACSRHRGYIKAMPTGKQVVLYGADMMPNLKEPAAFVVSTGTTLNLDDVDKVIGYDFERIREDDKYGGLTTRALVILPLTIQSNRTIGILQIINPGASTQAVAALSPEALQEVQSLAGLVALYMWNARLVEDNTRLKRQFDRHLAELPRQIRKVQPKKEAVPQRPKGLIGESPPIEHAIKLVGKAAWSPVPILVRGETGTGKEMMAAFIHMSSDRANKPFVVQNCAALPEALLESELFGHVKGAFTGANTTKLGLAHEANGGTLFLDEIGDMPLALQAKVLRLLQEGEVRRVGSTKTEKVDVRIVGATNINLEEKIASGEFRQDLFYRLNVFPINLPPLARTPLGHSPADRLLPARGRGKVRAAGSRPVFRRAGRADVLGLSGQCPGIEEHTRPGTADGRGRLPDRTVPPAAGTGRGAARPGQPRTDPDSGRRPENHCRPLRGDGDRGENARGQLEQNKCSAHTEC